MNLVETWVTNVTQHVIEQFESKSYDFKSKLYNLHKITADFDCYDCYGRKEYQATKYLTEFEYKSVLEKGYYLT